MSYQHMLSLLERKKYWVDTEIGDVYNKRDHLLKPFSRPNQLHQFVRLFDHQYSSSIGVGRLVWMSVTKEVIPNNWEIHHIDQNPLNNSWGNLQCLHPLDHQKLHKSEEVPF